MCAFVHANVLAVCDCLCIRDALLRYPWPVSIDGVNLKSSNLATRGLKGQGRGSETRVDAGQGIGLDRCAGNASHDGD